MTTSLHYNTVVGLKPLFSTSFPADLPSCATALQLGRCIHNYFWLSVFTPAYPGVPIRPQAISGITGHTHRTHTHKQKHVQLDNRHISFSMSLSKKPWAKHPRPRLMSVSCQRKTPCGSLSLLLLLKHHDLIS